MLADYTAADAAYDEVVGPDGLPRAHARAAMDAVARRDPRELAGAVRAHLTEAQVGFASADGDGFLVDPVPRVIPAEEWEPLAAGLAQRVRALNAFVADVHGPRRILAEGAIPARVVETCEYLEPRARGVRVPSDLWVGVAGLDVVRDADGRFLVLEDNLRTPSGLAYAVAAREAVGAQLDLAPGEGPRPIDEVGDLLAFALRGATPEHVRGHASAALLTEGAQNPAFWEQRWLAARLGVPVVAPDDLAVRDGRLWVRSLGEPLDVVYRRTNADHLDTELGRLLEVPWRQGRLGIVNAFGTGVADDKLTHAYVEELVRFYDGEEPLLASVPTYDLAVPEVLEHALDRFEHLVVKPRSGYGGVGVMVCPHAEARDVARMRRTVRARPEAYIAQELVMLSTHPTVCAAGLAPRHVDLRPFVFMGEGGEARVLPGGLTRVAFNEGSLVVNSSQNGGAKDTWVLR